MRIIDSLFVSVQHRVNEQMWVIVSDHWWGGLLQWQRYCCSTLVLIKATFNEIVLYDTQPRGVGFGNISLSLFWSCFLFSLPSICFFQTFFSFFAHFFPFSPLSMPALYDRTNSTCRCRLVFLRHPWAVCCCRFCVGRMVTREATGRAAGEEQLWSVLDGRKVVTGCCLIYRPKVDLAGIYGTSLTLLLSLVVGTDEVRPVRREGRIRGKRRLWKFFPLVFCAPPLPSPLFSSWALTPSASPLSCGLLSAWLHHYQHCSGLWDILCLQIHSTL